MASTSLPIESAASISANNVDGHTRTADDNSAGSGYSISGTRIGTEVVSDTHLLRFHGGYFGNYIGANANESAKVNGGASAR